MARAAAHAHNPGDRGIDANRELFDAIEHAATDARLDLRDIVDAYTAGARDLELSDAFADIEDYLRRITDVQHGDLAAAFARAERALPDWRRQLALRIAAHDTALAAHRALGDQAAHIEHTRQAVADGLDGARAAGATEQQLDTYIRQLRIEQCDLVSVLGTAAWLAAEGSHMRAIGCETS